jgi:hypothetical protein
MQERMRFTGRWLTWFCLSLLLWAAVAESTHNHPNQTESAACSICVVAQSTAPIASCHYARPVFEAIGLLQEKEVSAQARLSVFDLGIRGPPTL